MRKLKFTGIIILALIIVMQFAIAMSLADEPGSITLHKYAVGNLGDFEKTGTGAELDGDYELNNDTTLADLKPMEGITFTLTPVEAKDAASEGSNQVEDYVVIGGETPVEQPTDTDGEILWDALDPGYYLIEEETNDLSDTITPPFIVQIPMTNPDGNGLLYDVHVYPKNVPAGPAVEKELVALSGNNGSNVLQWEISVDIPNDIKDSVSLKITDELDPRLTYVTDSVTASYIGKDGNEAQLVNTSYQFFTVAYDSNTDNTLVFELTTLGRQELDNAVSVSGTDAPKLYFKFDTIITVTDAEDLESVENSAEVEYTNSANHEYNPQTPPDPPSADLYGIEILKEDSVGAKLNGAKFKIYPTQTDAEAKTKALKDPSDSSKDWEITTEEIDSIDGSAYFLGLREGTYWLVETQTPNPEYNLLRTPVEVEVSSAKADEDNIFTVTVTNNKGFVLPTTGGEGTLLFELVGFVMIGLAAVILMIVLIPKGGKRRRLDATDDNWRPE